jgi:hypothetical protein
VRTEEQLQQIHQQMKLSIIQLINSGIKFEFCNELARKIIRTNYHTVELDTFFKSIPNHLDHEVITIRIDPYSTPKKVYKQIIDKIYDAVQIEGSTLKDSSVFTKDERLLLLVDINYLSQYLNKSLVQIADILNEQFTEYTNPLNSKEIYRYIHKIQDIRDVSFYISPEHYLI